MTITHQISDRTVDMQTGRLGGRAQRHGRRACGARQRLRQPSQYVGKRACEPVEIKWPPPPMDTRNSTGVISACRPLGTVYQPNEFDSHLSGLRALATCAGAAVEARRCHSAHVGDTS
ncbi:hypothetical protein EVAR_93367_1 [Eumeta japonica]|uniref:Uncharacterized protein n=1 Tax=Eumeta variegata TaxID=151549 RepID=A0A4C1UTD1_EUMVA|nr:hypothetical protein EVAR_93367_1 [Eumeta japonica]